MSSSQTQHKLSKQADPHADKNLIAAHNSKNKKSNLRIVHSSEKKDYTPKKSGPFSPVLYSVVIHAAVIAMLLAFKPAVTKEQTIHMITFEPVAAAKDNQGTITAPQTTTASVASQPPENKNEEAPKLEPEKPKEVIKAEEPKPKIIKKTISKPVQPVKQQQENIVTNASTNNLSDNVATSSTSTSNFAGLVGTKQTDPSYDSIVLGRLIAAKRYPEKARRRGLEAEVVLAFSINRDGSISNKSLTKESASEILNQEALEMLSRASPFPVPPENYLPGRSIEYKVPIKFALH